ncbi:MAG: hypothetical protein EXS31_11190 [Pedosphaera sp.]|nr:hypothetical protein [Pedosphaera sp.]
MKTIPIEIIDGVLRLPSKVQIPPRSRLAVIVIDEEDPGFQVQAVADAGGAFGFLHEEPELYSDTDVLVERRNPRFGSAR